MNRKYLLIIFIIIFITLTACSVNAGPMVTGRPSSMPSPLALPTNIPPTAASSSLDSALPSAPMPYPSPEDFIPDINIPAIVLDPQANIANSNNTIYEDKNSIYFLSRYNDTGENILYSINKSNRNAKIILNICDNYTVYKGNIYYFYHESNHGNNYGYCIKKYNIKTGKITELVKTGGGIILPVMMIKFIIRRNPKLNMKMSVFTPCFIHAILTGLMKKGY